MTRRTHGLPFTHLVPVHAGGSDPSTGSNPTRVRQAITTQVSSPEGAGTSHRALLQPGGPGGTFTITVDNAVFPSGDEIWLGDLPLIEGRHYEGVNGNANTTADRIAAAIVALYGHLGWSAVGALGDFCIVNPPPDPQVRKIRLKSRVSPANLIVSARESLPDDVFFGAPSIIS